jgi:biopolymer transport protein ExbD
MLNSTRPSILVAFTACITLAATATAAEAQRWSVLLNDDAVEVRASKNTPFRFVRATIDSLQEMGRDNVTVQVLDPNDEAMDEAMDEADVGKMAYSIELTDGVAQVSARSDLPYGVIASLINQLKGVGVTRVELTTLKHSAGEPLANEQEDILPRRVERSTASEGVLGLLAESVQAQATDMMTRMVDGYLTYLAKPETTEKLATFQKNYFDALVEQGFSEEQAFELVLRFGNPLADGSPTKR